jgi:cytoskeletal protein RodZ
MQAGINMTKANPKKKPSKRSLFALSPLFLAVFVVGWIKTWIGQLGKQQNKPNSTKALPHKVRK